MSKNEVTKKQLLNRGWSEKAIKELLPEPRLEYNPYSQNRPIKLWDLDLVENMENSEEFLQYYFKKQKRSEAIKR